MANIAAEHLILFIASLLMAASVAGVFTNAVERVSQALSDRSKVMSAHLRTDIEIISVNGTSTCVYNCSGQKKLRLLVKNTGTRQLPARPESVEIILDGRYQPPTNITITVLGPTSTWRDGAVARVTITATLHSGDHRVKVVMGEASETFLFRIPD